MLDTAYSEWTPAGVVGCGLLSGVLLVAVILAVPITGERFTPDAIVTNLSTVPFITFLIAGGYWLSQSDLTPDQYPRIGAWMLGCFLFFVALFSVITFTTQDEWVVRFRVLHWAGSVSAGSGLLIGSFEARAINRALVAERTRIRNEELRRQNERLENLTNIISHDLRNPLNVAIGHINLLQDDDDDTRLESTAEMLDRMGQIIDETLTMARSGQAVDGTESVSLDELADQCWRTVETAHATLEVEGSHTVTADPDRVRRLFENLFRNAIEHGGETVTVRVGPLSKGFYIEDDGPGILQENRDTVFDAGYTTNKNGTGFGLAIVSEIAEVHGWQIGITAGSEGGARFEITGVETGLSPPAVSTRTQQSSPRR